MYLHKRMAAFKNLRINLVKTEVKVNRDCLELKTKKCFQGFLLQLICHSPKYSDLVGGIETITLQDKTAQLGRHISILIIKWFIAKT